MSQDDDDDDEVEIDDDQIEDVSPLPQVAQSEHDIIMMARALVAGPDSNDDIWALLCSSRSVAPKIGTTCARLLEDALRLAWRALWQRGGSIPRTSHTGARGRLWERYQPTELRFSNVTLQFLRWLVQTPFSAPASTLKALPAEKLEVGDQLMVYFALDAARATPALRVIAAQPFVQACPLAWLGFASYLAAGDFKGGKLPSPIVRGDNGEPIADKAQPVEFTTARGATATVPPFTSLVYGAGPIVVEALADELAKRWQAGEVAKRSMTDPEELISLGAAQDTVLQSFLDACDQAKRRDLASFILDAVVPLLTRNVMPAPGQLDPSAPLSLRANARTSAGSLLRAVVRWSEWDQQHRGVRFIDDEYQSAQLLLHRFERIGSAGTSRVQGWLADLAALAPTTPSDTVPVG